LQLLYIKITYFSSNILIFFIMDNVNIQFKRNRNYMFMEDISNRHKIK